MADEEVHTAEAPATETPAEVAADTSPADAADTTPTPEEPEKAATEEEQPVPPEETPPTTEDSDDAKMETADKDSNKPALDAETATDATGESETKPHQKTAIHPIVSSSKKSRPPYKYDPDKITLRFLFANRDGLTVTIECNPSDTVGEVKAALLSVWPNDIKSCSGGDHLRLVCMGKGYLMPDTRTLEDCQIPIFKTHPTPINVSVRPEGAAESDGKAHKKKKEDARGGAGGSSLAASHVAGGAVADQGCGCVIL